MNRLYELLAVLLCVVAISGCKEITEKRADVERDIVISVYESPSADSKVVQELRQGDTMRLPEYSLERKNKEWYTAEDLNGLWAGYITHKDLNQTMYYDYSERSIDIWGFISPIFKGTANFFMDSAKSTYSGISSIGSEAEDDAVDGVVDDAEDSSVPTEDKPDPGWWSVVILSIVAVAAGVVSFFLYRWLNRSGNERSHRLIAIIGLVIAIPFYALMTIEHYTATGAGLSTKEHITLFLLVLIPSIFALVCGWGYRLASIPKDPKAKIPKEQKGAERIMSIAWAMLVFSLWKVIFCPLIEMVKDGGATDQFDFWYFAAIILGAPAMYGLGVLWTKVIVHFLLRRVTTDAIIVIEVALQWAIIRLIYAWLDVNIEGDGLGIVGFVVAVFVLCLLLALGCGRQYMYTRKHRCPMCHNCYGVQIGETMEGGSTERTTVDVKVRDVGSSLIESLSSLSHDRDEKYLKEKSTITTVTIHQCPECSHIWKVKETDTYTTLKKLKK